jgi:hypothetical protein
MVAGSTPGCEAGSAVKLIFSTRRPKADSAETARLLRPTGGPTPGASVLATRAARPAAVTRKPSAASCSQTAVTVVRETPSSAASARVEGARIPSGSAPLAICARRRS